MVKRSGMAVKETSYYGSLEGFLNPIGHSLKPFVRAIINTKNIGSGIPDGGLFTKEQFSKGQERIEDFVGTTPSRGVIEIKSTSEDVDKIAESEQVKKYLKGWPAGDDLAGLPSTCLSRPARPAPILST